MFFITASSLMLMAFLFLWISLSHGQPVRRPPGGSVGGGATTVAVVFVDMETPTGALNGTNRVYLLGGVPTSGSLHLFRNGILLKAGVDYGIVGAVVVFASGYAPASDDILLATYRK